jgi:hypothetical protein
MKTLVLVLPFLRNAEMWLVLNEARQPASSITSEPPGSNDGPDDSGEPEREYPFWTYFTDNPRPKNSK